MVEPLYRATVAFDRHRLAELAGEISGRAVRVGRPGLGSAKALSAAALSRPGRAAAVPPRVAARWSHRSSSFADPAVAQRVLSLGGGAPRYPLPGPSRDEVLAAIA